MDTTKTDPIQFIPKVEDSLTLTAKKRFAADQNKTYDEAYSRHRMRSWILNDDVRARAERAGHLHSWFMGKDNIEKLLIRFVGMQKQATKEFQRFKYFDFDDREWYLSYIPAAIENLNELVREYEHLKTKRKTMGYEVPEWPAEMLEKFWQRLAHLDILCFERDAILRKLEPHRVEDEKKKPKPLMKGARGQPTRTAIGNGNILEEIDYQKVKWIGETLVIHEKTSPYYGMSVPDYREHIVKKWKRGRKLPVFPKDVKNHLK